MEFKIGQSVKFLNEPGSGKIIDQVADNLFLVLTDEGLEIEYEKKFLVPAATIEDYSGLSQQTESGLIQLKLKSDADYAKKIKKAKTAREAREMQIDLHIYELTDSTKGMSNHDMLQLQLKHFRAKMSEANSKKIYRLIIIHGVGEGVLKSEIRHALRNYEHIEFGDADYTQYGYGATQVIFKAWD